MIFYIEEGSGVKFLNSKGTIGIILSDLNLINRFLDKLKERKCILVNMKTGEVLR